MDKCLSCTFHQPQNPRSNRAPSLPLGISEGGSAILNLALRAPLRDLLGIDERPRYRAPADLFHAVVGGHAENEESPVGGFQHCLGMDPRAHGGRRTVLDADVRTYAVLSFCAKVK